MKIAGGSFRNGGREPGMAYDEKLSKTQRKKSMHALQALGEQLVDLNREQIAQVPLPDELREAVLDAKRISAREGLRRQLQYLGRLMREAKPEQVEAIRAKLDVWKGQSRAETMLHRGAERWRERLLEDDAALAEFASLYPGQDLQPLRALLRAARRERTGSTGPRHFRELYRAIRGIVAGDGMDDGVGDADAEDGSADSKEDNDDN